MSRAGPRDVNESYHFPMKLGGILQRRLRPITLVASGVSRIIISSAIEKEIRSGSRRMLRFRGAGRGFSQAGESLPIPLLHSPWIRRRPEGGSGGPSAKRPVRFGNWYHSPIPKGLHPSAQQELRVRRATLGGTRNISLNPNGVASPRCRWPGGAARCNPFRVVLVSLPGPRVSTCSLRTCSPAMNQHGRARLRRALIKSCDPWLTDGVFPGSRRSATSPACHRPMIGWW